MVHSGFQGMNTIAASWTRSLAPLKSLQRNSNGCQDSRECETVGSAWKPLAPESLSVKALELMGVKNLIDSLRRGLRRPEVRQHPIRAISRRLQWRRYWRHSADPIILNPWWRNLKIALPNTSNSSLLFYRTLSDPSLACLLQTLLYPGMTFLDVGAHIGEFTLIGAHMVGSTGRVCAIEPLPPCAESVRRNAAMNGMAHVTVFDGALCDYSGKIGFQSDHERSAGWIATGKDQVVFEAPCWTLDDFLPVAGISKVDVIKLDAGGNELAVLRGGGNALENSVLIMKLYHPDVTQERFGYRSHESVKLLLELGFQVKLMVSLDAFPISKPEDIDAHFDRLVYCHLLMATKNSR